MPLDAWRALELFRGRMLAAGWTPSQFEGRIEQYTPNDIALALNPERAIAVDTKEAAMPFDPIGGARIEQGIPID